LPLILRFLITFCSPIGACSPPSLRELRIKRKQRKKKQLAKSKANKQSQKLKKRAKELAKV